MRKKYSSETIFLWKYSQKEIVEFVRENCTWFNELSRTGDPRVWGSTLKAEANTSADLLIVGNEIRISPSCFVLTCMVQVIHKEGYVCGEGVLSDVSANEYIEIKI